MSTDSSGTPPAPGRRADRRRARVPLLLRGLIDDAAVFPPGNAPLAVAVIAHARHRAAWYADLVGPLLLPFSALARLPGVTLPAIGVIGDTGPAGAAEALAAADERWRRYEVAVAKRGEDPRPGLQSLFRALRDAPADLDVYAEIPLTRGLLEALDLLAAGRAAGTRIAPKFRTGGLAAELFPTPVELAAVICACRDRDLPFKLTAGLHHAVRHPDPETGFTHHGFLNVLAGCLAAAAGAEVDEVAGRLGSTEPAPLVEVVRPALAQPRPLWIGFGSCSVMEPLADLTGSGLIERGAL